MRSFHEKFSVLGPVMLIRSAALSLGILLAVVGQAQALSELGSGIKAQTPAADGSPDTPESQPPEIMGLPTPDPLINPPETEDEDVDGAESPPATAPALEVIYDISKAPEPVRRMRELIIEAAASGDITRLRALLNPGPNQAQIMSPPLEGDPVDALKSLSGDPDGVEILAIMLDILATGFVHVDAGTPEEAYVWPYFAERSVTTLTPTEKVELLRIVTAGDFADMLEYGNYNFYRLGITADGQWKFFTAGD